MNELDCTKRRKILPLPAPMPFLWAALRGEPTCTYVTLYVMGQCWWTWLKQRLENHLHPGACLLLLWSNLQLPSHEWAKWTCWMMRSAWLRDPAKSSDIWVRPLISSWSQMYIQAQPRPAKELHSWAKLKCQLTELWANSCCFKPLNF